ncbi:MAG TPA: WG repeat-containing protein [Phnomibacter sp.]|nr:WG repeat-containing protein [Phnomibacter sp.]
MKRLLLSLIAGALVLPLAAQKWHKNFDFVDECICSVSKVKKDGKIGYVDINGKVIVPLEFAEGLTFNEGYSAVRKESKWAFLDSSGRFITDFLYADAQGFSQGLAPAKKGSGWGFIDTLGKEVIPFEYSNARKFSEGLAAVSNKGKELWGFINRRGEVIIPFALDFADSFDENGEARVVKRGQMMWIDKYNQKVRD